MEKIVLKAYEEKLQEVGNQAAESSQDSLTAEPEPEMP
jgi:hypothetical protein